MKTLLRIQQGRPTSGNTTLQKSQRAPQESPSSYEFRTRLNARGGWVASRRGKVPTQYIVVGGLSGIPRRYTGPKGSFRLMPATRPSKGRSSTGFSASYRRRAALPSRGRGQRKRKRGPAGREKGPPGS